MMQISIDSLVNPDVLTTGLSILFVGLMLSALYASLKLRSMFGIFGFMLMVVAFVSGIVTGISFLWFWLTVVIEMFILFLASTAYTRAAARAKN